VKQGFGLQTMVAPLETTHFVAFGPATAASKDAAGYCKPIGTSSSDYCDNLGLMECWDKIQQNGCEWVPYVLTGTSQKVKKGQKINVDRMD